MKIIEIGFDTANDLAALPIVADLLAAGETIGADRLGACGIDRRTQLGPEIRTDRMSPDRRIRRPRLR